MILFEPKTRQVVIPEISGIEIQEPDISTGIDWSVWFDHFWQGKGSASYAASLLDLVGANNLIEGNGIVPWDAVNGWQFISANAQFFNTAINNPPSVSTIMVQYVSWSVHLSNLAGAVNFRLENRQLGGVHRYINGGALNSAFQTTGNLAIASNQAYKNGAPDGVIPAGAAPAGAIDIGRQSGGGVFPTVNITAVGVKLLQLTAPQVAAAAAAMATI